jgi:hypothetical protein
MEKEKYHKFRSQYGIDLIKDFESQKTNTNDVDNLISVNMTRKEFAYILDVLKEKLALSVDVRDKLIDEKGELTKQEKIALLKVMNEENIKKMLTQDILDRYDNAEYWNKDLIEVLEVELG